MKRSDLEHHYRPQVDFLPFKIDGSLLEINLIDIAGLDSVLPDVMKDFGFGAVPVVRINASEGPGVLTRISGEEAELVREIYRDDFALLNYSQDTAGF